LDRYFLAYHDVQLIEFQNTLYICGQENAGNQSRLLLYSLADGSTPILAASSQPYSPVRFTYKLEATQHAIYITSPGRTFSGVPLGRLGRFSYGVWEPVEFPSLRAEAPLDLMSFDAGLLIHGDFTSLADGTAAYKFAYVPDPVLCIADQNCDGGVDGSDIEPFFIKFAAANPSADVNNDGGVDGSDVEAFSVAWAIGDRGCR